MKRLLATLLVCVLLLAFLPASALCGAVEADKETLYENAWRELRDYGDTESLANAARLFGKTGMYGDAIALRMYAEALMNIHAGEYAKARDKLEALEAYKSEGLRAELESNGMPAYASLLVYISARQLEDAGKYDEALAVYDTLTIWDALLRSVSMREKSREARYAAARQLLLEGRYVEAAQAFEALGDYSDSAAQAIHACALLPAPTPSPSPAPTPSPTINPAQKVTFADPAFEAIVRKAMNKPYGAIYAADACRVEQIMVLDYQSAAGLTSLAGIEYFTGLQRLVICAVDEAHYDETGYGWQNAITLDISALQALPALRMVQLTGCSITDISCLSALTGLEMLVLSANDIRDISALRGMKALKWLDVSMNPLTALAPLRELSKLEVLNLTCCGVADLSPLTQNTGLQFLMADYNQITDLSPLAAMRALKTLRLACNPLNNLAPLAGLAQLEALTLNCVGVNNLFHLRSLENLRELYVQDNPINDISALAGLRKLSTLMLDNCKVYDLSPLAGLTALNTLSAMNNAISDIGPLSGLTALTYLALTGNKVTDYTPIAGLRLQTLYK